MSTCYYYPFSQLGKNNSSSDIKLIEQFNKDPNSAVAASANVMQQKSTEELQQELSTQSSELELLTEPKETQEPQEPKETQEPQEPKETQEPQEPKETQEPQEPQELSDLPEDSINIHTYNKPTEIITTPASILTISNPNKFSGLIFLCLFVILLVLIFRTR